MCTALITHIHEVLNPPPVKRQKKGKLTQVKNEACSEIKKNLPCYFKFCMWRHTQVGD